MLKPKMRSRGDPPSRRWMTTAKRTRKRVRFLLSGVILIVASLPTPAAATPSTDPGVPPGGSSVGPVGTTDGGQAAAPSDALNHTARQIAAEFGISVEAALTRLKHQESVAPLIGAWRRSYPESFAGAHHATDLSAYTTVRWVGQVPAEILAQVSARALAIGFDTSAQVPESTLVSKTEQIFAALADTDFGDFSVSPDILNEEIVVALAVDDDAVAATGVIEAIRELETPTIGARVQWVSEDLLETGSAYGGTAAQLRNSTQHSCTLAFAVRRGSTEGLLSAGHCPDSLDYVDPETDAESALTLEAEYEGYYGDYAWYSIAQSVTAQFYTSSHSSGRRHVTAVKPQSDINIGDTYCLYGRRTNSASCGTVKYTSTCHRGGDHDVCNQVRVRNVFGRKGDSGGPWYVGYTAVGIHTGCFGSGCGDRNTRQDQSFTPVALAETGLGVSVLTR